MGAGFIIQLLVLEILEIIVGSLVNEEGILSIVS
jgi:hypothetical protein